MADEIVYSIRSIDPFILMSVRRISSQYKVFRQEAIVGQMELEDYMRDEHYSPVQKRKVLFGRDMFDGSFVIRYSVIARKNDHD